jgi:hypothetical protein
MMTHTELHITTFTTTRFSTQVPGTFADAVQAFEQEVPALSVPELLAVLARHHNWDDVLAWTAQHAPWGFLVYWRNEVGPVMSVAGDAARCISYLMGNHTIAETMFRHDARVMNYAPLRVEITQEPNGPVLFTTEVPSSQFASFEQPDIAEVGTLLDDKLAKLLQRLGAQLPETLQRHLEPQRS